MTSQDLVEKTPTGIEGFDLVANGGLPIGRITLIAGTAGSAKTIFATQFIAESIEQFGERGVFVTFEETPDDIRRNVASLSWNIAEWKKLLPVIASTDGRVFTSHA